MMRISLRKQKSNAISIPPQHIFPCGIYMSSKGHSPFGEGQPPTVSGSTRNSIAYSQSVVNCRSNKSLAVIQRGIYFIVANTGLQILLFVRIISK